MLSTPGAVLWLLQHHVWMLEAQSSLALGPHGLFGPHSRLSWPLFSGKQEKEAGGALS